MFSLRNRKIIIELSTVPPLRWSTVHVYVLFMSYVMYSHVHMSGNIVLKSVQRDVSQ